jgi:hypothetical protein
VLGALAGKRFSRKAAKIAKGPDFSPRIPRMITDKNIPIRVIRKTISEGAPFSARFPSVTAAINQVDHGSHGYSRIRGLVIRAHQ